MYCTHSLFDFCTLISLIAYSLFPPFYVCPYFNHREFCVYFPPKNLLLISIRFLYPFINLFHSIFGVSLGLGIRLYRFFGTEVKIDRSIVGGKKLLLQQIIQHSIHCKIDILQRFLLRNQKKIVDYCKSIVHETKMQIKFFVSF